jgi:ribosomal-protein-alanine N-acetyltransferase
MQQRPCLREFPILKTERLMLRSLAPEDQAGVFAIYSNPEVTRFCDVATLANQQQASVLIQVFQAEVEKDGGIRWAITQKGSPRLIGLCGVGWYRHNASALLSYDLNQDYWNRGIMTEAVQAVVRYVFDQAGTNRITATTTVDNTASMHVLLHAGFQEEGILREWGLWKGEFKDLRCFSLLRKDTPAAGPSNRSAAGLANSCGGQESGDCTRPLASAKAGFAANPAAPCGWDGTRPPTLIH